MYDAKTAQRDYETLLREAREGVALNKESFYRTEEIVSSGVKRGQHVYHIMQTYDLGTSSATIYRHIHKGYYSISNIDLPRVVKFKPQCKKSPEKIPESARKGRTFAEFLTYCEENDIHSYVDLDTIIGTVGGKVILTIHFTAFNFMVGILLENKISTEVARKNDCTQATLSRERILIFATIPAHANRQRRRIQLRRVYRK